MVSLSKRLIRRITLPTPSFSGDFKLTFKVLGLGLVLFSKKTANLIRVIYIFDFVSEDLPCSSK